MYLHALKRVKRGRQVTSHRLPGEALRKKKTSVTHVIMTHTRVFQVVSLVNLKEDMARCFFPCLCTVLCIMWL